jgi:DNA (cytosine-5)-methyltransferase 1
LQHINVVDIFAGPGGLAEGFSRVVDQNGSQVFRCALSIEKEEKAHETLRLRSFLRQFVSFPDEYYRFLNEGGDEPDWGALYPKEWQTACDEAWQMELGVEDPGIRLDGRLDEIRAASGDRLILVGGPPCQAYSLVGRSRNAGNKEYRPAADDRHFLYKEYIRILDRLQPAAFVMENVKGLLSSSVDGSNLIINRILEDLRGERQSGVPYRLVGLAPGGDGNFRLKTLPKPRDFLLRSEDMGVPQARHRVIILGIREDLADAIGQFDTDQLPNKDIPSSTVRQVLQGAPRLRSGLSKSRDSAEAWKSAVRNGLAKVVRLTGRLPSDVRDRFRAEADKMMAEFDSLAPSEREADGTGLADDCPVTLKEWLVDPKLFKLPNNDTRGHMEEDLARYLFCSLFVKAVGRSPNSKDFPEELAPNHKSWKSGSFANRFRVQTWNGQATTVTCHISKDGHYFIHPDPVQCRSLTVREAARIQTFPDNYLFKGARTHQYTQVGNAVPPFMAMQIGQIVHSLLRQRIGSKTRASKKDLIAAD